MDVEAPLGPLACGAGRLAGGLDRPLQLSTLRRPVVLPCVCHEMSGVRLAEWTTAWLLRHGHLAWQKKQASKGVPALIADLYLFRAMRTRIGFDIIEFRSEIGSLFCSASLSCCGLLRGPLLLRIAA